MFQNRLGIAQDKGQVDFVSMYDDGIVPTNKGLRTTEELERNVCEFYVGGLTQREIADLYGITQGYVSKILTKHEIPTPLNGK